MGTRVAKSTVLERVAALAELALDTPEIILDLDIVHANIDRAATMAREMGVAVRPHTKTHKLPHIARMQLEAGAVGVQVAKLGEAEVMADAGIENILVGYPIVGARKLARLADLAERVSISVTIDSDEVAAGISRVARERGLDRGPARARYGAPPARCPPRPRSCGHCGAHRGASRRRARWGVHPRGPRLHAGP